MKKTILGGAEVEHETAYTDQELQIAFSYLYRLQSLRYDQNTSLDGMVHYTIMPSEADQSKWIFISLNDQIPVCITPEFELAQMINMAKTALLVTQTIKKLRMSDAAV